MYANVSMISKLRKEQEQIHVRHAAPVGRAVTLTGPGGNGRNRQSELSIYQQQLLADQPTAGRWPASRAGPCVQAQAGLLLFSMTCHVLFVLQPVSDSTRTSQATATQALATAVLTRRGWPACMYVCVACSRRRRVGH